MAPIVRARRVLLTCLLLAVAALGGLAASGAASATPAARASIGPSVTPASAAARAVGRSGATSRPAAGRHVVESGTTLGPVERGSVTYARPSAQHSPLSQIVGELPHRRGPPAPAFLVPTVESDAGGPPAVTPSPSAARAPPSAG